MGALLIAVGLLFILAALFKPLGYLFGLLFIVSGIMLLWSDDYEVQASGRRAIAGVCDELPTTQTSGANAEPSTPVWW
jgi:predicted tellurium resistance membrane protein TerC